MRWWYQRSWCDLDVSESCVCHCCIYQIGQCPPTFMEVCKQTPFSSKKRVFIWLIINVLCPYCVHIVTPRPKIKHLGLQDSQSTQQFSPSANISIEGQTKTQHKVKFLLPFVALEVMFYFTGIHLKLSTICKNEGEVLGLLWKQPQVTVTNYTVSSGPSDWSSGICDCCDDCGICLCGTFIPCILGCKVAQDYGESCCLPCLPGAMIALRTSIRHKYHISGSVCDDWVIMSCIAPCGLCQMAREQKMRG